jgi:uncharacterized protein YjbI with pentapeptide repeats
MKMLPNYNPLPSDTTFRRIPETTEESVQFLPIETLVPSLAEISYQSPETLVAQMHVQGQNMRQRGEADRLRARIPLIPVLLQEVFTHPFGSFTLVKRNNHVFVVRKGADLREADLSGADLRRADLRETNFQGALLVQANLEEANLAEANLRNADLREANLRKANLEGAILNGCDLRRADLLGARVDPAVLSQARLEGALLDNGTLYR